MVGRRTAGRCRAGASARRVGRIWIVALLFAGPACGRDRAPTPGGQNDERADPPVDTVSSGPVTPEPANDPRGEEWTIGITADSTTDATGTAVVAALRTGSHEGYDRVTIEFDTGASLPGYHIEYIDRPLHECGSGRQVHPVGDAWLEIRLDGAAAHTDAGQPTLPGREMEATGTLLRRIYRTCDFEGVVTFVVALSSPQPYRVLDLEQPSRLVVDFQH